MVTMIVQDLQRKDSLIKRGINKGKNRIQYFITGEDAITGNRLTSFVAEGLMKRMSLGKEAAKLNANDIFIPGSVHLAQGDFSNEFIADRDSDRTKGEVLGADCPEGKEEEPLYLVGEIVKRDKPQFDAISMISMESHLAKQQARALFAEQA